MSLDALIDAFTCEVEISPPGTIRYYNKSGELHRLSGPAVITPSGWQAWFRNGVCHRTDGPAIEYTCGTSEPDWYLNGTVMSEEEFLRRIASGDYSEP